MEQMTKEEVKFRQLNMSSILAGVFRNFSNYGLTTSLRKAVEDDLTYMRFEQNGRKITMQDLEEFMLQVAGYIFFPKDEEAVDE